MEDVAASVDHGDKNKTQIFRTLSNDTSPCCMLYQNRVEKMFDPNFGNIGRPNGPWWIVVLCIDGSTE